MPVLVTGASGFLGGRLAQMLLERGEEVMVLARGSAKLDHLPAARLTVVRGSLTDESALRQVVSRVTHIYHCAACSTDWAPLPAFREANVLGTERLLSAACSAAPRLQRFLHVSTTDVYGYPEIPCPEEHPIIDAGLPYNQTKGEAERAVWAAHREHGLPVTIVRPATIYGPRGKDFTVEIAALLRLRLMALIDGGLATGGFTYVDNVAEAMIAAAAGQRTLGETYNLSDGTGASWREYVTRFARHLGLPPPWIDLSSATAMRLARGFEALHRSLSLRARPLLTRHAVLLLARHQEFPIGKAREHFGFSPAIPLDEGLRRSVTWLRT